MTSAWAAVRQWRPHRLGKVFRLTAAMSLVSAACAEVPAHAQAPAAGAPITGAATDYDPLLAATADARFVLLGESTHGTREFYRERARITERLIREQGVLAVAIEADWPEVERLNRYVRGQGRDRTAEQALSDLGQFPGWMWRNAEFGAFAERLRAHNLSRPPELRVGVYGMDVQNLYGGTDALVAGLARIDPPAAARARAQYRCFARHRPDPRAYGEATRRPSRSCERQTAAVLAELRRRPRPADPLAAEAWFSAVRGAAVVAGAEAYYRAAYAGAYSWNVRDRRMAETVEEIADHAAALSGRPGKVAVWAHNTHVGDARATDMALRGELNLGQLLRQRHGEAAFLVGFLTHSGRVMAAREWDAPGRIYALRSALPESYAGQLHRQAAADRLIVLRGAGATGLDAQRLQRAVGVVYQPENERTAHYFKARLSRQFDAVVFIDRTEAVTALK